MGSLILDRTRETLYSCRFTVVKKVATVRFGVHDAVSASAYNFKYNFQNIVLVENDGQIHSTADSKVHNSYCELKFATGDVVELLMDTTKSTLRVSCNGQEQVLNLPERR